MDKKEKTQKHLVKQSLPEPDAFVNTHAITNFGGKPANLDL